MSFLRRLFGFARVKAEGAMDRHEDPMQLLESAYRRQLQTFDRARLGVVDVLTAEKRLEIEANALHLASSRYERQAAEAVRAGDDDVARLALMREEFATAQRERVLEHVADIRERRVSLEASVEKLRMQLELFRTEKLALGARLASARASAVASETAGGYSIDAMEIARSVERARDHALAAQARSEALAQLSASVDPAERGDAARIEARLSALKGSPPALG